MSEDHERRISTVEANFGNLTTSLSKIERWMGELFQQQSEMKTSLALVVQNQTGMKEYQKECDDERANHEKRITAIEGFQGRVIKFVIAVTGIGSLASPQLAKLWGKIFS